MIIKLARVKDDKVSSFDVPKIHTYKIREDARMNSMDFSICRYDPSGYGELLPWEYYYRGELYKSTAWTVQD